MSLDIRLISSSYHIEDIYPHSNHQSHRVCSIMARATLQAAQLSHPQLMFEIGTCGQPSRLEVELHQQREHRRS